MPKKTINIILILIVLGLWGTVLYKSVNRFFSSNEAPDFETEKGTAFDYKQIKKDTFELQNLDHDPFLNRSSYNPSVVRNETKSVIPKVIPIKKPAVVKQAPQIFWPQINYYGYIKSAQKNNEMILIKINNVLYKARKNDNLEGIEIKRIFKDSIEVNFSKTKKFIYLNR